MSRPKQDLLKAVQQKIPPKSKILLAVSGGKDSIALLHACSELSKKLKLTLSVAHVNHGLRASASKDEKFVQSQAGKFAADFFLHKAKPPAKKSNLEAWGRNERYKFLEKIRNEHNLDFILTAHTASDVAETLLMRLVSNKELTSIEEFDESRKLVRPLLSIDSRTVLAYIKKHKLKFVQDETNLEDRFLRNKVRLKLLPHLEKNFDLRIAETLTERAMAIHEDVRGLYALVENELSKVAQSEFGSKDWLRAVKRSLSDMPEVLAWRFAEGLLKPELGFNLGREKSRELLRVLKGERQAVQLPGGYSIRLKNSGIFYFKV